MRFLADIGVSYRSVEFLESLGHDAVHLSDQGLPAARSDTEGQGVNDACGWRDGALGWETGMKITYDQEVDILRIILSEADIEESDEDKPGVIIDYDDRGNVVGLEILDASSRMTDPRTLEYAVTG